MFTIGKRPGQSLAATSATGLPPSRLFYVMDRFTGLRFLVDTSAEISVIPPSRTERKHQQDDFSLQVVNNTAIATYSRRSITLDLGLQRTFRWVFVVADVKNPILGADFLRHYCLLIDVRQSRLSDALTQLKVQGIVCQDSSPNPAIFPRRTMSAFENILSDFPMVMQPHTTDEPVKHDVMHIETTGPPVSARPCCLAPDRLKSARQEFDHMLQLGITRPSSSFSIAYGP